MKTTLIALIFLLIGGVIGGFLALGFGAGMGAASGMLIGSQAGVCLAVETAAEQGLLGEPDRQDALIAGAVAKVRASTGEPPPETDINWIRDASGCRDILAKLKAAEGQGTPGQ